MKNPIIEVIVTPTGETKIETKGFTGSSCKFASAFLEAALGTKTGEQMKAEFHQNQSQHQSLHQGGTA